MKPEEMGESIRAFFIGIADKTARTTKFVQRKSKLTGSLFLQILVFGFLHNPKSSLNDLSEFSEDHFDVAITSQGIDERINKSALTFMETMFETAMNIFRNTCRIPLPLIKQFSAVNITDSTGLSLPESLSDEFPGSGGSASESALKLQLVFDFLTGCFRTVTLMDGITPDQRYKEHIRTAEQNSLNLFDPGYFKSEYLRIFSEKGAYFLCRLLRRTGICLCDGTKINILRLLRTETRDRFESEIHLGTGALLRCRLCCFRVPDEVASVRRRNAIRQAAKKGRTPGRESLELMNRTIFVTNVPTGMLQLGHIALLYSVRWQIELIFKLWKSHMAIHMISGFRRERVLTELYAKLIGLILFQYIAMPLRNQDTDLSPAKVFRRFIRRICPLAEALRSPKYLIKEIRQMCFAMLKFGKREKRRKRLSTCQKLLAELCDYS